MSETLELLQSRSIKIYSTLAQNLRTIETTARNCGELMADMDREGIPYRGMSMVIGETAQGLVGSSSALLPGEQTILLMPIEVKSGSDRDPFEGMAEEEDEEEVAFDDYEEEEDDEDEESVEELSPREEAIEMLTQATTDLNAAVYCINSALILLRQEDNSIPKTITPVNPEIERLNRMAASIQQATAAVRTVAPTHEIFD